MVSPNGRSWEGWALRGALRESSSQTPGETLAKVHMRDVQGGGGAEHTHGKGGVGATRGRTKCGCGGPRVLERQMRAGGSHCSERRHLVGNMDKRPGSE